MSGEASDSDDDAQELQSPFKSPCVKRLSMAGRPSELLSPSKSYDDLEDVDNFLSFKTQAELAAEKTYAHLSSK